MVMQLISAIPLAYCFISIQIHIRVNFLLVWAIASIIAAIYYFSVWLFWKTLISYSQFIYARQEQTSSKYAYSILLN